MPDYFFHLVKGPEVITHDATGHVCANDHAAQKLARQGDGFSRFQTLPSDVSKHYHVQVVNEAGQILATVPFSHLKVGLISRKAFMEPDTVSFQRIRKDF